MVTSKDTVCAMSDEFATAQALGGKFQREDCGFFETCDHKVEKYDMTIPGGSVVEIFYCNIDWKKVGPLLLVIMVFIVIIWRKSRGVGGGGSSISSSNRSDSSSAHSGGSRHKSRK